MPDTLNADARKAYELQLAQLQEEMKEMRSDIKGLVEAWNTAKGMTSFVKWLSGIVVAAVSLYAIITGKK